MNEGDLPAIDIVSLCYNDSSRFVSYANALGAVDYPTDRLKLTVVDNGSPDSAVEELEKALARLPFSYEIVRAGRNLGFGGGCNFGAMRGVAPFVLFLNNDACLEPDAITRLIDRALNEPRAGLIEAAQEPRELPKWRDPQSNYTDWCSGAALLARRDAFLEVGMFDSFFYPIYCEDVDLSWRMWLAGWRCVYEPKAKVTHHTLPEGGPKPTEVRLSIRYSFAMRFIYDTPKGLLDHLVRGVRYLCSPRTEALRRRAVAEGLWTIASSLPHLLSRRRAAQSALRQSTEQDRFVFTEWYYGRWIEQ